MLSCGAAATPDHSRRRWYKRSYALHILMMYKTEVLGGFAIRASVGSRACEVSHTPRGGQVLYYMFRCSECSAVSQALEGALAGGTTSSTG